MRTQILSRIVFALTVMTAFITNTTAFAATWNEQVLYSFQGKPDGSVPAGGLIFDKHGNLYGATLDGGVYTAGAVFQLAPPQQKGGAWAETALYSFGTNQHDGASPEGGLVIDAKGNLYGVTGYGGTGTCILLGLNVGCGIVYEISPPTQKGGQWTETILYSFQGGKDGQAGNGSLVFDKTGNLYGATIFGGGHGICNAPYYQYCGTVFKLSKPKQKGGQWTEQVLHSFTGGSDGSMPNGGLAIGTDGVLYGTALHGANTQGCTGGFPGCGVVFSLRPSGKKNVWLDAVLYAFQGGRSDGAGPNGGLLLDAKGRLYGTTVGGGKANGEGSMFILQPPARKGKSWTETIIYTFASCGTSDGCRPMAGLTFGSAGELFGTTAYGGSAGGGTAYVLKPAHRDGRWVFVLVHTFTGSPDGSYPVAALTRDSMGNLYGTTQESGLTGGKCGNDGCGIVFETSQ